MGLERGTPVFGIKLELTLRRWLIALAFALILGQVESGFDWLRNGELVHQRTVQMWYDGYWKEVGWVNGTVKWYEEGREAEIAGHVAIMRLPAVWKLEAYLRRLSQYKPKGILVAYEVPNRRGEPGGLMYSGCDGRDRRPINVPVADAPFTKQTDLRDIPDGTYITALWEENRWKTKFDTKFQVVIASIISIWEVAIIIFGCFRIYQFYLSETSFNILSIGPLCLCLEVIATSIRFAHTSVDPFASQRIYPTQLQSALLTIHVPFTFASGILLSFFWAESLSKTNMQATPFISKYRNLSIAIITGLFVLEIIFTTLRTVTTGTIAVAATWAAAAVYLSVTILLIVSFLMCAVAIFKRIGATGQRKHSQIRALTIRFGLSILGYVSFVVFLALLGATSGRVVVTHLMLNFCYASLNWVATMQVLALRPIVIRYTKSTRTIRTSRSIAHSNSHADDGSHPTTTTTTTTSDHSAELQDAPPSTSDSNLPSESENERDADTEHAEPMGV